jgi:hypothetical protein
MTTYKKKIKFKVMAISLAPNEDRIRLGINDTRIPAYRVGMEAETSGADVRHFSFLSDHITPVLAEHPRVGDTYTLTFEKDEVE